MKVKSLILSILACIFLIFSNHSGYTEEINNGPMTIEIEQSIKHESISNEPAILKINVPDTWSMSLNKTNDFVFKHLKEPDKIEITLTDLAAHYINPEFRTQIIDKSFNASYTKMQEMIKGTDLKLSQDRGIDTIDNTEIDYGLFTLKSNEDTTYFKYLYAYSKSNLFIIYVYFKDGAPFEDAEILINELVSAINKP